MYKKLVLSVVFILSFLLFSLQQTFASTVTYSTPNFSPDSNISLFGGSNIQIANGVASLNWNRPAVDSNHIGYFRFNDQASSVADDSSNHNTGSIGSANGWFTNSSSSSTAYAGANAAWFNRAGSEYMTIGNKLTYEYTQPWTVMAAIKMTRKPTSGAAIIFTNVPSNAYTSAYPGYEYWVDDNGFLHVRVINVFGSHYIGVVGTTNVADNQWHYVAATYDGSGIAAGVKIYLDGTAQTTTVESDTLAGHSIIDPNGNNSYTIGNQLGTYLSQFNMLGGIDEFIQYNVVKSPTFISSYTTPSTLPPCDSNCVLNFHFDEASGTTAYDSSPNHFNATASDNLILSGGSSPSTFTGLGGSSLSYDGTSNSYASFPHIASYNLGNAFTLSMWGNSNISGSQGIESLFKHTSDASPYPGWGMLSGWNGVSASQWWDGTAFHNTGFTIQPGWHNYTIRFNSGTLDFFVDGTNVSSQTGVSTPSSASVPLLIGDWNGVGAWNGDISTTTLSNTNRSDSYIQQFSKIFPTNGVISLSSPSASVSSGGGNFATTVNITNLAATFTNPNSSTLEYRIGVGSSPAAATSNKLSQSYTSLLSNNSLSLSGQYMDYDIRLDPSSDTIASTSPTLTNLTFTYSNANGGPTVPGTPTTSTPTSNSEPTWTWTASTSSNGLATPPYTVQWSQDSSFTTGVNTDTATTTSYTMPSALSDGIWYLRVQATDSLGNPSGYSSNGMVVIDTTAPSIPGMPSTTSPSSTATPTWTWTASTDSGSGLASTPYTVQWSQDNTFTTGVSSATATANSYTHTSGLSNGTWYFRVRATDAAGNNSAYSSDGTVVINVTNVNPIVIDNVTGSGTGFTQTGTWTSSTYSPGYVGADYQHDGNTNKGSDSATWTPTITTAGIYTVSINYVTGSNRATNVPVTIVDSIGSHTIMLNEQTGGNGTYYSLGNYDFNTGTNGYVQISNTGTNGYVIADAVKFVFVEPNGTDTTPPTMPGTPSTTSPNTNGLPTWTWSASTDSDSGLATPAYTVQWSQDLSFNTVTGISTATTNSFAHSSVLSNGTWYFRVKATDAAGNSTSYSSPGSVVVSSALATITIDNGGSGYTETGTWTHSTSTTGYYGSDYEHDGDTHDGAHSATWTPTIGTGGTYQVSINYTTGANRATNVPVTIVDSNGSHSVTLNEQSGGNGTFYSLGNYSFSSGTSGYIKITNTSTNGYVIADAVKFTYVSP